MFLLTLIPLLVYALIFATVAGAARPKTETSRSLGAALILALPFWGALMIAITEVLGAFQSIDRLGLVIAWTAALAILLFLCGRSGALRATWSRVRQIHGSPVWWEYALGVGFGAVVLTQLVVGLITPPSNIDVLQYHLPRVLHWAQDQSLAQYAVAHQSQNTRPFWAEAAILNLRILWGNDRPASLVQWLSMLSSVLIAVETVKVLGGGRLTRWLSAALILAIPMGLLQAETAQNDYVAAFWVLALAYFVVLDGRRRLTWGERLALALVLGLGLLTKGTVIPFAAPLVAWYLLRKLFRRGFLPAFRAGLMMAGAVVVLNGAFWVRNIQTYGGPYGSSIPVAIPFLSQPGSASVPRAGSAGGASLAISFLSQPGSASTLPSGSTGGSSLVSHLPSVPNVLVSVSHMVAMNFVTPVKAVNQVVFRGLSLLPALYSPDFIRTLEGAAWNNELTAGNPLHMALIAAAVIWLAVEAAKGRHRTAWGVAVCGIVGYGLLSLINYSDWIFSIRYQLSFLVLMSPLAALMLARIKGPTVPVLGAVLVAYALPYILLSNMRPVIGRTPWPTRVGSVFTTSPSQLLFAQSPGNRDEYVLLTDKIKAAQCMDVGLAIQAKDQEYTFWWLLDAPQSGTQLRFVEAPKPVDDLIQPTYRPCAILCTVCGDKPSFHGLPLDIVAGELRLYMSPR